MALGTPLEIFLAKKSLHGLFLMVDIATLEFLKANAHKSLEPLLEKKPPRQDSPHSGSDYFLIF